MSLNKKEELREIARGICRDLRKNSTVHEQILWTALRAHRFLGKKFRRQHPIFHDITGKETFFVADFYCHEKKLIIELDGEIHKYNIRKDNRRTFVLNSLGIKVIRFKNEEVEKNIPGVLESISKYVAD